MKKNRRLTTTAVAAALAITAGILIGWLLFDESPPDQAAVEDISDLSDSHATSASQETQLWTCSMHPQIMQPEPGDCPICGMDLIPAQSGADGLSLDQFKMTENALALANIQTVKINDGTISGEGSLVLSGRITQNDEANSVQASYFNGRIESLQVTYEGQEVTKGQLLATIYSPNLVAAQQELLTAASLKQSQPNLYRAVRNKLKNWKLSERQINQIEESGTVRENFPVYATVSGTVTEIMVAQGDYVNAGQPIAKLSNLNTVWADFDAYENQLDQLQIGQDITITSNAYPAREFEAQISFIDPILNTQTRTVTVRATLTNKNNLLKPGMFVTGKVPIEGTTGSNELSVPVSAVMWTGERSLVYVKPKPQEPIFEMREVRLGNRLGDRFLIEDGLSADEEVVVNGTFTVDAAAQLQGKKSMMNPGESAVANRNLDVDLPASFQAQFVKIFPDYIALKDAFVTGNPTEISRKAIEVKNLLLKTTSITRGNTLLDRLNKSIEMLEAIANNDLVENQRAHFVILNENLVAIAKNLEDLDSTWYIQKCPMANNDQGAIWISDEREIRNPYYGDAMLSCGSVIDSIH